MLIIRKKSKKNIQSLHFCRVQRFFTLLEMIVTLAVFLILISIVLTFYDTVFKASEASRNSGGVFSNARVALDIITRDIQCVFYKNGKIPFWHIDKIATEVDFTDPNYHNDLLAFISATPLPQSNNSSKLCEVKYQLYNDNDDPSDPLAGWIRRSVTGDDSVDSWNFQDNFEVGENGIGNAFTANDDSSDPYEKLIPNVTGLTFECYKKDGLTPTATRTEFPYSIRIILSLVDDATWQKYTNLMSTGDQDNKVRAEAVKYENERTFTKTVFVGEHGQ